MEEALDATASNGGCRDCQDQRYVHLLIQELQSQKSLQDGFEAGEVDEEDEEEEAEAGDEAEREAVGLTEAGILSKNSASMPEALRNAQATGCSQVNFVQHNAETVSGVRQPKLW